MPHTILRLPEGDIRSQEMIFWLKKLALELPEATRPSVDLSPVLQVLNSQAERIHSLEQCMHQQEGHFRYLVRYCTPKNVINDC